MELTKELLELHGIKEGVKVKGLFLNGLKNKHQYEFPDSETITGIKLNEEDMIVEVRTDFLDKVEEINGKPMSDETRFYALEDNLDFIEIVEDVNASLPKEFAGEDYEATQNMFDFDFVSIPKDLIRSFKDVIIYLKQNKADIEEVVSLDDIKIDFDGLEFKLTDIEQLYNGVNLTKRSNGKDNINMQEKGVDSEPVNFTISDSPQRPEFI